MEKPTAEQIYEARAEAGLTMKEAAALIHSTLRTWQDWEGGISNMHAGLWELFLLKTHQDKKRRKGGGRIIA